jgi:uncharacterized integral membrane protein
MTEQPAPHGPTTTLPPQSANGTPAQLPLAHSSRKSGPVHTLSSGGRIAGALLMSAAGTARIPQLRQIVRRSWRRPPTS